MLLTLANGAIARQPTSDVLKSCSRIVEFFLGFKSLQISSLVVSDFLDRRVLREESGIIDDLGLTKGLAGVRLMT